MSLMVSHNQFLFIGNHPCLDFVNTQLVLDGRPVDLLDSFSDLVRWLARAQLLTEDTKEIDRHRGGQAKGKQVLEEARALRVTLREMVRRLASGRPVPQSAVETINGLLRVRAVYPQLTRRKGQFAKTYQTESRDVRHLIGMLAETASDLLCTCDLTLIKKCQNPACVLFFYDTTKNHARHWCSMSLCGNRNKVAAHYRRHRKRAG